MKLSTKELDDPYLNLVLGIIKRAVNDCVIKRSLMLQNKSWKEELVNDPEYYIFESEREDFPSFISLCHYLNCTPDYFRGIIRTYLLTAKLYEGMSPIEKVRKKIKEEREIMKSKLTRWAWDSLRLRTYDLGRIVKILKVRGEVFEHKKQHERLATFYLWIGGYD